MPKRKPKPRAKHPLEQLADIVRDVGASPDDLVTGLLRWTLFRCVEAGEAAPSVSQVAEVIEAAANHRAAGGGAEDDGIDRLIARLDAEETDQRPPVRADHAGRRPPRKANNAR